MWSGNPWLRSTSTHILAKEKIPLLTLSSSIFRNFPKEFPMADNTVWCQKCNGRLWSLTQTGVVEIFIVFASNSANQGVTKRPALPQNQGRSCNAYSLSFILSNLTIKNTLEHKWMSQFYVDVEKIHWCRVSDLGQNPLNQHIITFEINSSWIWFTSGNVIVNASTWVIYSIM